MKLSFVIPCYNSAGSLSQVVAEIKSACGDLGRDCEIILVNDGSMDGTCGVIRAECAADSRVKGIDLSRNFGQHSAQMAGFSFVTGDLVVGVDDDGQVPLRELPGLLARIEDGMDVVFAVYRGKKEGLLRRLGTWANFKMAEILVDKPRGLMTSNFFVIRRYIVDEMLRYRHAYPYIGGLIFRATQNIANVEVPARPRIAGRSNYTLARLVSLWFNRYTVFSIKPLRVASAFGAFIAAAGFLSGIYIILRKLLDIRYVIAGWSSLMAVFLLVGGLIMMMLGLIGEYISRIYSNSNERPQYVIRERFNLHEEQPNKA